MMQVNYKTTSFLVINTNIHSLAESLWLLRFFKLKEAGGVPTDKDG
jgi:hypothetical protein